MTRNGFLFTVTLIFLTSVSAFAAQSPWPKFRHDAKNTGHTPYTGPVSPALAWTFPAADGIVSSPAIGYDGTIYFGAGWLFSGTTDSSLYAVNPNGTLKWRFKAEEGFFSSPLLGPDGTLYLTSIDGHLYAVEDSVTYGKMRWRTHLEYSFNLSSPAMNAQGTIFVGSPSFYAYAVNSQTGAINWRYKTGWCIISSPAILEDGTVCIGSKDHKLRALVDSLQGPKWTFAAGTFYDGHLIDASPAVGPNGTIYVGSDPYGASGKLPVPVDTSFWAVNPDGSLKWAFPTGDGVESSPAVGPDGTIYFGSYDSCFYAVADSGTNGFLKWKYKTGGPIDGSPTVDGDGDIYVGSRDSTLYAFYPDGGIKWTYPLDGGTECSPTIDGNGNLLIGTFNGTLHKLGTGAPDVGVVSVNLPELVEPDVTYLPQAVVRNYRITGQSFAVACIIDSAGVVIYGDTAVISNLSGDGIALFMPWKTAPGTGINYVVTMTTLLSSDDNTRNNQQAAEVVSANTQYVCGDANGDGQANVGDVVYLVSYVFKGGFAPEPLEAGDANCDHQANVGDAVYLISYIFRGGSAPCSICP